MHLIRAQACVCARRVEPKHACRRGAGRSKSRGGPAKQPHGPGTCPCPPSLRGGEAANLARTHESKPRRVCLTVWQEEGGSLAVQQFAAPILRERSCHEQGPRISTAQHLAPPSLTCIHHAAQLCPSPDACPPPSLAIRTPPPPHPTHPAATIPHHRPHSQTACAATADGWSRGGGGEAVGAAAAAALNCPHQIELTVTLDPTPRQQQARNQPRRHAMRWSARPARRDSALDLPAHGRTPHPPARRGWVPSASRVAPRLIVEYA
jgi:hypothetical protein